MPLAYDGWTRKELEAEARRRGIRDAARLGRDGLVRRLRGESTDLVRTRDKLAEVARAALVGAVAEVGERLPALSRLFSKPRRPALTGGRASVAGTGEVSRPSPPPSRPPTPEVAPSDRFRDDPDTLELLGLDGAPEEGPGPTPDGPDTPRRSFRAPPAARPRPGTNTWRPPPPSAFPPPRAPTPAEAGAAPPEPPGTGGGSPARRADERPTSQPPSDDPSVVPAAGPATGAAEEPIRTRTFARLLEEQGHRDRAQALLSELGEDGGVTTVVGSPPASPAARPPPGANGAHPASPITLELDGDGVRVGWRLTEAGATPGRHLAGPGAALVVRLVTIVPDEASVVANRVVEHPADGLTGSTRFADPPPLARLTAAVGWRARGRFVSVAHTVLPSRGSARPPATH